MPRATKLGDDFPAVQALDHWSSDSEHEKLPARQKKSTHYQTSQNTLKNAIEVGKNTR